MIVRLAALVGRDAVRSGDATLPWSVHGRTPAAVVAPADEEGVVAVMKAACEHGWSVEPAGGGRWLDAGRPPRRVDIVLSTSRLASVREHHAEDLVLAAGAGLPMEALANHLAGQRQWLPLDPPGAPGATLGATFATASAGPLRTGYGTPRDHILGVEVVTGDGRLLRLGGRVVKNVAGYDLVRLMVGSRGTLGVITSLNVRLRSLPEAELSAALGAADPERLLEVVAALRRRRGVEAAACELMDGVTAAAVAGVPVRVGWMLLCRWQGHPEAVAAGAETLARLAREARLPDPLVAADAAEPWRRLSEIEASAAVEVRLADRPGALAGTLRLAAELAAAFQGDRPTSAFQGDGPSAAKARPPTRDTPTIRIMAHAAEGIVRVLSDDAREVTRPARLAALAAALESARGELESRTGTLRLGRAPAPLAGTVDPIGAPGDAALRLMRALKTSFDPEGVLSPGRFLP